jgi:hypothetical protein
MTLRNVSIGMMLCEGTRTKTLNFLISSRVCTIFMGKKFCSVEFDIFVFPSLGTLTTEKSHSRNFVQLNNYLPRTLVENVIGLGYNRLNCVVIFL